MENTEDKRTKKAMKRKLGVLRKQLALKKVANRKMPWETRKKRKKRPNKKQVFSQRKILMNKVYLLSLVYTVDTDSGISWVHVYVQLILEGVLGRRYVHVHEPKGKCIKEIKA